MFGEAKRPDSVDSGKSSLPSQYAKHLLGNFPEAASAPRTRRCGRVYQSDVALDQPSKGVFGSPGYAFNSSSSFIANGVAATGRR